MFHLWRNHMLDLLFQNVTKSTFEKWYFKEKMQVNELHLYLKYHSSKMVFSYILLV